MGITLARETAGGIRSVGWFEETENRLNKDRPTQFWTRLDRMTESVAIAERPSSCCDELRTLVCTYFAIGSRENRVAENGIGPAPVIPEQTGLRNQYCANQNRYQYGRSCCRRVPTRCQPCFSGAGIISSKNARRVYGIISDTPPVIETRDLDYRGG